MSVTAFGMLTEVTLLAEKALAPIKDTLSGKSTEVRFPQELKA